jgi:hypothetical protein
MSYVNLLKFLAAALVVGPTGGGLTAFFWIGATTANDVNNGPMVLVLGIICGVIALSCLVVLAHFFICAVRHPWGSRVCPACLSDVADGASVCRYCQRDLAVGVVSPATSTTSTGGVRR